MQIALLNREDELFTHNHYRQERKAHCARHSTIYTIIALFTQFTNMNEPENTCSISNAFLAIYTTSYTWLWFPETDHVLWEIKFWKTNWIYETGNHSRKCRTVQWCNVYVLCENSISMHFIHALQIKESWCFSSSTGNAQQWLENKGASPPELIMPHNATTFLFVKLIMSAFLFSYQDRPCKIVTTFTVHAVFILQSLHNISSSLRV